jgi:dihydrolipoamide dehydrogenase
MASVQCYTKPLRKERSLGGTPPLSRMSKRSVPMSIMFTDPPLAKIGAPPSGTTVTGTGLFADQGRAKVEARNAGLVQIFADGESGALIGAILLGPGMDHIAHLLAWAIERGETAARILELPFYHPTFEEGLKPPLRHICKLVEAEIDHLDDVGPPGA